MGNTGACLSVSVLSYLCLDLGQWFSKFDSPEAASPRELVKNANNASISSTIRNSGSGAPQSVIKSPPDDFDPLKCENY